MAAKLNTTDQGKKVLNQVREIQPFLEASLTITQKRCGNPKCRCATAGPIHQTALLTWKEGQKTKTIYVPIEMREEVTCWVAEGKKLKSLIKQMSQEQRKLLAQRKRRRKN